MAFLQKEVVTGLDEVLSGLDGLKKSLRTKHLRKATNDIARNILWGAKARTPKRRGILYKSLGRKVKVYKSGVLVAIVGARKEYRQQVGVRVKDSGPSAKYPKKAGDPIFANPTKYLHLVELGTSRGKAHHMLRDAARAARSMMRSRVVEAVEDALAEAQKGGAK